MNLIREILGWQGQLSIGCWHFKARSSLLVTAGGGEQRTNWKTTCLLLFLSASFPAFVRFVINFLLGYLYQLVLLFPLNRYIITGTREFSLTALIKFSPPRGITKSTKSDMLIN